MTDLKVTFYKTPVPVNKKSRSKTSFSFSDFLYASTYRTWFSLPLLDVNPVSSLYNENYLQITYTHTGFSATLSEKSLSTS